MLCTTAFNTSNTTRTLAADTQQYNTTQNTRVQLTTPSAQHSVIAYARQKYIHRQADKHKQTHLLSMYGSYRYTTVQYDAEYAC